MFSVDGCRGPGSWQGTCGQCSHCDGERLGAGLPNVPWTLLKALNPCVCLSSSLGNTAPFASLPYSACKQFGQGLVLTPYALGITFKRKMLKCNMLV